MLDTSNPTRVLAPAAGHRQACLCPRGRVGACGPCQYLVQLYDARAIANRLAAPACDAVPGEIEPIWRDSASEPRVPPLKWFYANDLELAERRARAWARHNGYQIREV